MFSGTLVALVTPFRNGNVDYDALNQLIDFHVAEGTDGLVPVGTTGESPTLSHEEHRLVVKAVVQRAHGKIPVIAGTGSNSTAEALELTQYAKQVGADAVLSVNPYYNKPTQEGLYQHFKTLATQVDIPTVLYNIPGRCAVGLTPETVARLAELKNIVAIKEASGSLDQASAIASLCDITILSGDDSLTLPLAAVGGKGVISVVANILPKQVKRLTDAIAAGDFAAARRQHLKLFPLFKGMLSIATNPIPIKTAMALLGKCSDEMRLPMCTLDQAGKDKIAALLKEFGLL